MADTEDIAAARRVLGARLAQLRTAAGLSQPQLAPLIGYSRSTIATAETGQRTAARDFWHRCDQVLATGGVLGRQYDELDTLRQQHQAVIRQAAWAERQARVLGWQQLADPFGAALAIHSDAAQTSPPLSLIAAHTVQVMEAFSGHDLVSRRDVLQQLTVLSGAVLLKPVRQWVAALEVVPVATGVGTEELDELDQAVKLFRRWDASGVGGLKRKAVVGQLRAVAETLRDTPDTETSRRLFQITAELAQLAGWMSYDQGLPGAAQRYYVLALHACREAGASSLGAKVIGDMMQLSTTLGHYDDSLNLARAGLYVLPRNEHPLVRAELLGLEARAHAQLGSHEASEAVRSAENCVSVWHERPDEPQPDWLHYMNQSEVDCLAANTYIQLAFAADDRSRWQRYAEHAEHYTLGARQARSNGYDRSRILDEIRLAKVRLAQREPVESLSVATNALRLAEQAHSSVVCDWLIRFHGELTNRYVGLVEADDFTGQLRDYIRRTAPAREREVIGPT